MKDEMKRTQLSIFSDIDGFNKAQFTQVTTEMLCFYLFLQSSLK